MPTLEALIAAAEMLLNRQHLDRKRAHSVTFATVFFFIWMEEERLLNGLSFLCISTHVYMYA